MANRREQGADKWMRPIGAGSLSDGRFIKPSPEARRAFEEAHYTPNEERPADGTTPIRATMRPTHAAQIIHPSPEGAPAKAAEAAPVRTASAAQIPVASAGAQRKRRSRLVEREPDMDADSAPQAEHTPVAADAPVASAHRSRSTSAPITAEAPAQAGQQQYQQPAQQAQQIQQAQYKQPAQQPQYQQPSQQAWQPQQTQYQQPVQQPQQLQQPQYQQPAQQARQPQQPQYQQPAQQPQQPQYQQPIQPPQYQQPVQPAIQAYPVPNATPRYSAPAAKIARDVRDTRDPEDDEHDERDAVPSELMASPAPVPLTDIAPPSKKRTVLWGALVAVVILVAAALALWQTGVLSQWLGVELPKAPDLIPEIFRSEKKEADVISEALSPDAPRVDSFSADSASAQAPAAIRFTLHTSGGVSDIRLLSDINATHSIDNVSRTADATGELWEFTVSFPSAFSGDMRAYIRDESGVWSNSGASLRIDVR